MYSIIFDNGHAIDGFERENLDDAVEVARDVYLGWIYQSAGLSNDEWNQMVNECSVAVFNYGKCVWPTCSGDVEGLGWVER